MKNILSITLISLLFLSCGGGDTATPEPTNTAPTVPTLVAPTNSKLCITNSVSFEWSVATDAESNAIIYQLQIALDNQFTQIVKTVEGATNSQTIDLEKGKAYYWRVKASDSKNLSSNYSSIYSFYTEGVALLNHLPFLPQLVSPVNNATITGIATNLKWTATDADVTDTLLYDVYLGTDNPPTAKVGSALSTSSIDITTLKAATLYYWKVVVKDSKGGETSGQVWSFKTN